jgi:hypothetical protein
MSTPKPAKPWLRPDGSCIFCDDIGTAKIVGPKGEQIVECPHKDEPEHKKPQKPQ